jgi:hypothetical protein
MTSISIISLILTHTRVSGLVSEFKKARGQRGYGVQTMKSAREYREELVGMEQYISQFGTKDELENAMCNVVIYDQNVIRDEFWDLKDEQLKDAFGIALKYLTRHVDIFIIVERELSREKW